MDNTKIYDKKRISMCCDADIYVSGSGEGTNWYVCDKCKEPCDFKPKDNTKIVEDAFGEDNYRDWVELVDDIASDDAGANMPYIEWIDGWGKKLYAIHRSIIENLLQKERSKIIKTISQNQKGQFETDSGHIAWYLDDLIDAIEYIKS